MCVVFVVELGTSGVVADEPTVTVVYDSRDEVELSRKIAAEAVAASIHLHQMNTSTEPLEAVVMRQRVRAGLRVLRADRIELVVVRADGTAYAWVVERGTDDGAGFALRTVEQLRGRLTEFQHPPSGAPLQPSTLPPKDAPAPPNAPLGASQNTPPNTERESGVNADPAVNDLQSPAVNVWLSLGGATAIAQGGVGFTPLADVGVRVDLPNWAVTAHGLFPLNDNEFAAAEGVGEMRVNLLLGELSALFSPSRKWLLELGPGAGLLVLPLEAETSDPALVARTDRSLAGVLFAHGGVAWRPLSWMRVRSSVRGGTTAPRPAMRFVDREVASWGRLFAAGTLAMELTLPAQPSSVRGEQ